MEYDGGDAGCKAHDKELGSDFRDIEAPLCDAPDDPDQNRQHFQKNQFMAEGKFFFLFAYGIHPAAEVGIFCIDHRFLRIFADAFRVCHHETGGGQGHNHPHHQTEGGAGKYGNPGDSLSHCN